MTTTPLPHTQAQPATRVLSTVALIRLITEIDDHGAIPARGMSATFPDLSRHALRQAVTRAQTLGLIVRSPHGIGLTDTGRDLADLYDTIARWARRHHYPAPSGTFTDRIRHTLRLISEPTAHGDAQDGVVVTGNTRLDVHEPQEALARWIAVHERQLYQSDCELAA
ncbi:regulator [Streptomyces sp. SCSIO 30461]|uniref:regulator n=1 Tax=Streptomyces sp. SCSIO 30461 TaxID=3118085 RepID=UPI0030D5CEB4